MEGYYTLQIIVKCKHEACVCVCLGGGVLGSSTVVVWKRCTHKLQRKKMRNRGHISLRTRSLTCLQDAPKPCVPAFSAKKKSGGQTKAEKTNHPAKKPNQWKGNGQVTWMMPLFLVVGSLLLCWLYFDIYEFVNSKTLLLWEQRQKGKTVVF